MGNLNLELSKKCEFLRQLPMAQFQFTFHFCRHSAPCKSRNLWIILFSHLSKNENVCRVDDRVINHVLL